MARASIVSLLALCGVLLLARCIDASAIPHSGYVGVARCGQCHADQTLAWRGSHHDRAMEKPTEATVLGNFDDVRFSHRGADFHFLRRDGAFVVRTAGPGGDVQDFEVKYTFGFEPLQQYLLELPGGRLQALTVAWDSRPAAAGGQRWFHLQPEEAIAVDDVLHWTGPFYNWNARCASCHSTHLQKNYDLAGRRYATSWSEIDVSCEACHGPGDKHVDWANDAARPRRADNGLVARLGTAKKEVENCAPCHSRRHALLDQPQPGASFLDGFLASRLSEGLYFADGQIEDEVYVYGSFLQSKMHAAGVRCSDCHDPHSLTLRASGNALCAPCHNPSKNARFGSLRPGRYDDPSHHHHATGSVGAQCVSCHMPERNYMVIDDRRDHSLRIPRPDLSAQFGVPNACTGCHSEKPAAWAAAAVAGWYDTARPSHWTSAFADARAGAVAALDELAKVATDRTRPAIVRATATELLSGFGPRAAATAASLVNDPEPLVRAMAVRAFDLAPAPARVGAAPLLVDPVRAVRLEAARVLAAVPEEVLTADARRDLAGALAEYRQAQEANLDTPEAHLNLGVVHAARGEIAEAQREYETAIDIGRYFLPAYVNLADLHRATGREAESEKVLRQALAVDSGSADAHHALGLSLVRQGRISDGVESLRRGAELDPGMARYAYTYGVALHSTGEANRAVEVLQAAHRRHPADTDVLSALIGIHSERGEFWDALLFARKLGQLMPDDPTVRATLASLEARTSEGTGGRRPK